MSRLKKYKNKAKAVLYFCIGLLLLFVYKNEPDRALAALYFVTMLGFLFLAGWIWDEEGK